MTPKQLFQSDKKRVSAHLKIVDLLATREGLVAAYTEYCWNLPGSIQTVQTSWDANNRRQGAKEFIDVFLRLADKTKETVPLSSELEPETPA